uniref:Uncharacterized protein n=2 Tax=Panagrolaimus sp. JU765 TaxID=591449 RepID=A0AC34RRJ7_9BILA
MSSNNESEDFLEKTMEELLNVQKRESERRRKDNEFLNRQLVLQTDQSENQRKNEQENHRKDESLLIDVTRQNTMVQQHQFAQFQAQINALHNSYNAQLSDMKNRWDRDVAALKSQLQAKDYEIGNLQSDVRRLTRERNDAYRLAEEMKNKKTNSKYHIVVLVEGGIEKTTEFSNEEDATETALLAFHTFKTKSFAQPLEKPQKRTLQPQQTSFEERNAENSKIGKKAKKQTKTIDSLTSNEFISQWTTTLTQIVESMQESNENNSRRLERIIDRLQNNQVEFQGILVSEQQKTREFMREILSQNADLHMRTAQIEILSQNADLHMRTAQMLTDMNVKTLENATAQQNRFLEHQQHVLAIENDRQQREDTARILREEREALERRDHEWRMEQIRNKPHRPTGLFGTIGGWIDSIF